MSSVWPKTPANEYKLSAGNLFAIEGQFSKTVMFNNICFQLSFLKSQGFLQEICTKAIIVKLNYYLIAVFAEHPYLVYFDLFMDLDTGGYLGATHTSLCNTLSSNV